MICWQLINLLVLSSRVTTPCLLTLVMLWMMFCGFMQRWSKTSWNDETPRILCRLQHKRKAQFTHDIRQQHFTLHFDFMHNLL